LGRKEEDDGGENYKHTLYVFMEITYEPTTFSKWKRGGRRNKLIKVVN
jgi:hypothetical protein